MEKKVTTLAAAIKTWCNTKNETYSFVCKEDATNGDLVRCVLGIVALLAALGLGETINRMAL